MESEMQGSPETLSRHGDTMVMVESWIERGGWGTVDASARMIRFVVREAVNLNFLI